MIISAILFPLSDILRWTDIVSPALNPKSLEPRQQARASRRRKPKISRAVGWGAPRRPPPRTCQRTGRQRWGTRRKVKRWTTNWLRRKSKKHLALLLFLFLMIWGQTRHRGCKMIWCLMSRLSPPSSPLLLLTFPQSLHITFPSFRALWHCCFLWLTVMDD